MVTSWVPPPKLKTRIFISFSVCEACGSGLVDYACDFEAGYFARVLRGLTLVVVEVGWNRYHGFPYCGGQEGFSVLFYLLQNEGRDLLRSVLFSRDGDFIVGSHFSFYFVYRAFRVGGCLSFRGFSD
jgi:hypothetical protein